MALVLGIILVIAIPSFVFIFLPALIGTLLGLGTVRGLQKLHTNALEQDMQQCARQQPFTPEKSFVAKAAIAFDTKRQLFYIGTKQGSRITSRIYPISALLRYRSGHDWVGATQKFFLDITVDDVNMPSWHLWFGGDHRILSELTSTIDVLRAQADRRKVSAAE